MPTYDYRCPKCGNTFEAFQPITAPPNAACPACGEPAKRMISTGIGVIFKGTGFYQTDYKQKETGKKGGGKKPASKPASDSKTGSAGEKTESAGKPEKPKPEKSKEKE